MITADKGTRVGNWIVDTLILITTLAILTYLISIFYPEILDYDSKLFDILFGVAILFYYLGFEFVSGRTIGKMISGTIVIDKHGNKPSFSKIFIRSIIRLTPIYGLSFLFGNQGLHDWASNTTVIKFKKDQASNLNTEE